MGTIKTIFLIETTNKEYRIRYSGGLRPDWAHLTEKERKRMKRREARKAQKCTSNNPVITPLKPC